MKKATILVPEGQYAVNVKPPFRRRPPAYLRLEKGVSVNFTEKDGGHGSITVVEIEASKCEGMVAITLGYDGNIVPGMRTVIDLTAE